MTLIDRYVVREFLGPFFFGLGAFVAIFLASDVVSLARLMIDYHPPFWTVAKVFLLRLPQIAVWTLPMAVLLATLLSVSRFSSRWEMAAFRALGLSFHRIVAPVFLLGLAVSVVTLLLQDQVVPAANAAANRLVEVEIRGAPLPMVTENVVLEQYEKGSLRWFLYAPRYDSRTRTLHDVTLVRLAGGRPEQTIYARRMVWEKDTWYLEDGTLYRHHPDGRVTTLSFAGSRQPIQIGRKPEEVQVKKTPEEMSIAELARYIHILEAQGKAARRERVQLNLKYSIPLASLVFTLLGAPLGVQQQRSTVSLGFGISIALIFAYYVLMTLGTVLGEAGTLPPWAGAWLHNFLTGGVGLYFLARLGR